MADFVMPSLGADMESATLVKWHVKPGDAVKRGDIIAEVDTDKGIIDVECFQSGIIEKLVIEPGAKIPVGALLAVIQGGEAPVAAATPVPAPVAVTEVPHIHVSPLAKKIAAELGVDLNKLVGHGTGPGGLIDREDVEQAAKPVSAPQTRVRVSPLARRRAEELHVDVTHIQGSGPDGAIEAADIERAAAPHKPSDAMRRAIAAAMAKSKREIPHYYLQTRIDMSALLSWLQAENQKRSIKDRLLPVVPLLKALAKALRDVPQLNGFWIDGQHRVSEAIHLGFAISMKGGGLVAPAIHDVDKKSCDELMTDLRDLIPRARSGRLRSSEMTDATITITSLGDLGVETVFGVIYPPQVAIVGLGKIMEQPWAKDGMLGVHPVMTASLAADHRATDGHLGAQFLEALNRHLQTPDQP
ncbi:dihydrolipoamide acetyltransferase family protein [Prosthecobacter sp.]|uniref:dihydrolipoamide acetyltransferase family protein n=1 Tax=Prosthecobacter sp. TaxID=1965333 RepID=UPI002ABCB635|nr:dihydrolipoamide acetyltransferase family protein [Prosthecobacter sp.]MDZ4403455.1 dihydrolipoamide acetyltransferase family protein [Prosthecobacter sp.]